MLIIMISSDESAQCDLTIIIPVLGYEPALPQVLGEISRKIPEKIRNRYEVLIIFTPLSDAENEIHELIQAKE